MAKEIIELIERMSKENRLWGAERIRGELLKLGMHVSKRTIQKYMRQAGARSPTEEWTAQQLREVAPFGSGPQLLIRDGDTKYGAAFDRAAEGADIEIVQIAPCVPRMNSVCERFLGGIRRECLERIIILGEDHLRRALRRYTEEYFNTSRPHQGIGQRIPSGRGVALSDTAGKIVSFPVLNGLHHDYRRVA